jgi:hypothetical protein
MITRAKIDPAGASGAGDKEDAGRGERHRGDPTPPLHRDKIRRTEGVMFVPKSKVRKNRKLQNRRGIVETTTATPLSTFEESPKWFAPVMVAAFLIGLLWIVVYYVSGAKAPIPSIHNWNMVVGFVFIGIGFTFATRWK